jgi:glucose-1-phosphate thymidylyltransferase
MKSIKGIILAGGNGSRLYPLTLGTSKQLLPVYDKPMIYYPLSVLMEAEIKDILIISSNQDLPKFKKLLGNGNALGINISYQIQLEPNGIAESFIIGEDFIKNDNVCLILGDNIFHGDGLISNINNAKNDLSNGYSSIFGVSVENPENFGVIEFDNKNQISRIIEKPKKPKSNIIVSGLYFYTNDVIKYAKNLKTSSRGEKEITDINNYFLSLNKLRLNMLSTEISWVDTGTYSSLIQASKYFENFEKKTNRKAACIEEIALKMGYINKFQLQKIADSMIKSSYGKYLLNLI